MLVCITATFSGSRIHCEKQRFHDREWLIPLRVACHDVARAALEARFDQNVDDEPTELEKEALCRPIVFTGVGVENGVVLIGAQKLLFAPFAAECEPAKRHRRLHAAASKLQQRQLNRAPYECVVDLRNHVREEPHPDLVLEVLAEELLSLVADRSQAFPGLGT